MLPEVISIDPPTSVDLDDAVAATRTDTGWIVDVCIPDVPSIVDPGGRLDRIARERAFTRYGGDFIRQAMLPTDVAERLSLSPRGERPMAWFRITLDRDLQVEGLEIKRIRHRTHARLGYLEADQILADEGHDLNRRLSALSELADGLHRNRSRKAGALFDVRQHVYTTEEGLIATLSAKESHRSHLIVMEMMILTNAALAEHCRENGIPIIYRNHVPRDSADSLRAAMRLQAEAMIDVTGSARQAYVEQLATRVGAAECGVEPEGHFGLGLQQYAWFTSPLRRYCDVVNLRSLLYGVADPDPASTAAHIDTQMRVDREHHGVHNRRKIISHVLAGRRSFLKDYDLHTIIRACAENGVIDDLLIEELRSRLDEGAVSGKDIESIFTYGREVIEECHVQGVVSWLAADVARMTMFSRDMLGRGRLERLPTLAGAPDIAATMDRISELLNFGVAPGTFVVASEPASEDPVQASLAVTNSKGALLELAAARKAQVSYGDALRVGPPHDPEFTVVVTWTLGVEVATATGTGRSVKDAEREASARLLERLPAKAEKMQREKPAITANPKSTIMEMAAAEGAVATFVTTGTDGPAHRPCFHVRCTYLRGSAPITAEGSGATRKEAERSAASAMIAMLAARREA